MGRSCRPLNLAGQGGRVHLGRDTHVLRPPCVVCGRHSNNPNRIPEWEQRLRRSRTRDEEKPSGFSLISMGKALHRGAEDLQKGGRASSNAESHVTPVRQGARTWLFRSSTFMWWAGSPSI